MLAACLCTCLFAGTIEEFKKTLADAEPALNEAEREYVSIMRSESKSLETSKLQVFGADPTYEIGGKVSVEYVPKIGLRFPVRSHIMVKQVIGKDVALISVGRSDFWVDGFDTSGFVDGWQGFVPAPIVLDTGTKQYSTAIGGTRTVKLVTVANTENAKAVIEGHARLANSRSFKGIGDATFLENSKGVIRLQKFSDKDVVDRRFSEFPLEEQEWIRRAMSKMKR